MNILREGGVGVLLDRLPVLISYIDASGRLQYANRALLVALGKALDTPLGVSAREVFGEDIYLRSHAHMLDVMRGEHATFLDSIYVNGQPRHLELTFIPDTNEAGEVQGCIGIGYDLTDRVQRATTVAIREQELRSILNTMAEGLLILDRDGRLVEANPAAERILSLTRAQLLGWDVTRPHWKSISEDGLPLAAEDLPAARVLRSGVPERERIIGIQIPDAPMRWVSVNAQPLRCGNEPRPSGVVGTFVDVTELRDSMERIRGLVRRAEDVREKERQELALLLHEGLAQDLFSARLALGSLLRDKGGPDQAALTEISKIIDRCLAETRQVAGSLRPTGPTDRPISEVIAEQSHYFESLSKLRISLHMQDELQVSDEATRLLLLRGVREALINIMRHARAMVANIFLEISPPHLQLRVVDDGIGVQPGSLEKAGSLGLLGIRERARALGGTLTVSGNATGGTTLVLRLPLAPTT